MKESYNISSTSCSLLVSCCYCLLLVVDDEEYQRIDLPSIVLPRRWMALNAAAELLQSTTIKVVETMYECSLPMYDMPEVQKYNGIILKYLAKEIRHIVENKTRLEKYKSKVSEKGVQVLRETFGNDSNAWTKKSRLNLRRNADGSIGDIWESGKLLLAILWPTLSY